MRIDQDALVSLGAIRHGTTARLALFGWPIASHAERLEHCLAIYRESVSSYSDGCDVRAV